MEEVSGWQKKLSTTDTVMTIWFEIQRAWSHLESIFIGSEDIRNQLPEDSKRFDGIDQDFKDIMANAKLWFIKSLNCSYEIVQKIIDHASLNWTTT